MGFYYNFYSPKTGQKIDDGKYVGMPFFVTEFDTLGHKCAVKWDKNYKNIEAWTIDAESDFYKEYCSDDIYGWDWTILYYTKDEILKMQKSMTCNKTLLEELLENNKLDGLIIVIN
jgi:hypothetical protein